MEHVNEIWENLKDHGVLVGKGGLYSNVSSWCILNSSTARSYSFQNVIIQSTHMHNCCNEIICVLSH